MKTTQSAGGVVLNGKGQVLVVSQHGTSWSLPKGHIDPGEDALAAAKREIYEETGVKELTLIRELGAYERHRIGLNALEDRSELKVILFFLFKTAQNTLKPLDADNPEARWVDPEKVAGLLTHAKDKEFFLSVLDQIKNDGKSFE
ncbi:MAG: NUDIX domain-containing protein [Candidatus Omnitrophica bacterium]|nr:NUDIX domain-containing protein [Candidatus Omnitrophota bacterium]